MKRKLIAAIVGIVTSAGLVGSAHAQGFVTFGNYNSGAPVLYGAGNTAGGTVGAGVNTQFTAGLWYFLGTTTLAAGNGKDLLPAGWELASVNAQFNTGQFAGAAGVGYFVGTGANSTATIPDYVSGPITFSVLGYDGGSYVAANNRGHSAGFTLSSIATGTGAVGEFGPGLTSFSVFPVPEPSIFALSGLGAAALMLIRRKK
jgi:hypothetical protein